MTTSFDYCIIASCEYQLEDSAHPGLIYCGEPATHRVWWGDGQSHSLLLCPHHFHLVCQSEHQPIADA